MYRQEYQIWNSKGRTVERFNHLSDAWRKYGESGFRKHLTENGLRSDFVMVRHG